jgi:ABC-2 type transport system permease protein
MWSVFNKEINQFFGNLTGVLAIVLFLLINGVFLFVLQDSSIFDFGYANLDKFFELSPWVLMFLVPAITMRLFSDEFKVGTFEILKTKPLTDSNIILGKYFSILLIILFVLIPTIIYVITIKFLSTNGSIDTGGLIGSYIGLFLLSAVFSSIGLCCSSITSNAVVAFLISAFSCLLLYFGFSALSKLSFFVGTIDFYVEMLGIDFHFRSMSRGVLDTRDLIYFLSIITLALFITKKQLAKR